MNYDFVHLNWLARQHKELPVPHIHFYHNASPTAVMASYSAPVMLVSKQWREQCDAEYLELFDAGMTWNEDGEVLQRTTGLIHINLAQNAECEVQSSIAHEYRHHWQFFHYGAWWPSKYDTDLSSYNQRIAVIKYFHSDVREADALRFELRTNPSDEWVQRKAAWLGWPTRLRAYSLPSAGEIHTAC